MLKFVPMLILMGGFAAIGLYWTFLTRHFLKWASSYNATFNARNDRTGELQPVAVTVDCQSRQPTRRDVTLLTWGTRLIGGTIAGFALIMIGVMISAGV